MTTDRARASVRVEVGLEEAFRIFTEEIDQWWRPGRQFRVGQRRSFLAIEPGLDGRLIESFETKNGHTKVIETGRVLAWDPPNRVRFAWRNVNFRADEETYVEVTFVAGTRGTMVTVTHWGWDDIRPDHPSRHGLAPGPFLGMIGRWWGDLLAALRRHATD